MTILPAGATLALGSFPNTVGGYIVVALLLMLASWWLTGRIFRERDYTTLVFRGLISVLFCIGVGFFHESLMEWINQGPLAPVFETKEERNARLQGNMRQWMDPASYDAYWSSTADDLQKLKQMSPAQWKEYNASKLPQDILVQSAVRGLTWMALEHRRPSESDRASFPHSERGTMVLNKFTAAQAQAMFDYVLIVDPRLERNVRPCLHDALAYCREAAVAPASPVAASAKPAEKSRDVRYPFIEARRETPRGRAFIVRFSATKTQVVEASSEEEALKIARKQ